MIVDFGMSEKFKNMTLGKGVLGNPGAEPVLVREFSEETQKFIDEEIARLMDSRYKYVIKLLKAHKELLNVISTQLIEKETMEGKEFQELLKAEGHCKQLEDKSTKPKTEKKPKTAKKTAAKKD
jgi:cell division protease FtsH